MTTEGKLAALGQWQKTYEDLDQSFDLLKPVFGCVADGPLWEAAWRGFERYTATLGQLLGDGGDWLNWYCYENDMGAEGLRAGYGEEMRPIKNLDDLLTLIDEGRQG